MHEMYWTLIFMFTNIYATLYWLYVAIKINTFLLIKLSLFYSITICEMQRFTALSKSPCSTLYFSASELFQNQSLNQLGYEEIQRATWMFYIVRQCSVSLYFTYLYSMIAFVYEYLLCYVHIVMYHIAVNVQCLFLTYWRIMEQANWAC